MNVVAPASPVERLGELIRPDRVHGSLYTDPAIYAAELERIWFRTWVYVGHVSEIPEPNDYVVKSIGPEPVILTRDGEGTIHLLQNRCAHRANLVCDFECGNTATFTCPYHGWMYANSGKLLSTPFKSGYGKEGLPKDVGLGRVPRVDQIHGFVFGSLATDGPTLREHLGAATEAFDRLARLSPEGEVDLRAGWLKHKVRANWKMLVENETDGYHPQFVHRSIISTAFKGFASLYGERSASVSRDLGGGHTECDLRPEFRKQGEALRWCGTTTERLLDYARKMRAAYGDEAEDLMTAGSPHVMIFPNLFLAEIQIFVIQPLAVDETVQHATSIGFKGAPDLTERLLRQTVGSVGPAGLLLADDSEMYERNQRGAQARSPEWLILSRGLHRERTDAEGLPVADITDELPQRAIWRHWRSLMEAR